MYQIDNDTVALWLPTIEPIGVNPNAYFKDDTRIDPTWLNTLMLEICNVITNANIVLDKSKQNQLFTAINTLIDTKVSEKSPNVIKSITQTGHGFRVGEILYYNGVLWGRACANTITSSFSVGIVASIQSTNVFNLGLIGFFENLAGLVAGNNYYLSQTIPGAMQPNRPTEGIIKAVFIADSSTSGFFFNFTPIAGTSGAIDMGALLAENNLSDLTSKPTARNNLGLGSASLKDVDEFLVPDNNLSDLTNVSLAHLNLGLGSAALANTTDFLAVGESINYQPVNPVLTNLTNLTDPGADRITFWKETANQFEHLELGTNLSILGNTLNAASGSSGTLDNAIFQARLTLTSTDPIGNNTGTTILFLTPYKGNMISTYNGSIWVARPLAETAMNAPATTNTVYDIFVYWNGAVHTLEHHEWATATTRAGSLHSLTLQDNIYVLSGAPSKRYIGTIATSNTTGILVDDGNNSRLVWNMYNRVPKKNFHSPPASWSFTTPKGIWRRLNNDSSAGELKCVCGGLDIYGAEIDSSYMISTSSDGGTLSMIAISLDGAVYPDNINISAGAQASYVSGLFVRAVLTPPTGLYKVTAMERLQGGSGTVYYESNYNAGAVWFGGLQATVMC